MHVCEEFVCANCALCTPHCGRLRCSYSGKKVARFLEIQRPLHFKYVFMIRVSMTSSAVDILSILCTTLSVVRNMNSYFIKSSHSKNIFKQTLQSLMRFMF